MFIKTGDLRPDSHADDDMSKKAEYADGFRVVSKPTTKKLSFGEVKVEHTDDQGKLNKKHK